MEDVFLGIGSNVGDRLHFLADAIRRLKGLSGTSIVNTSSVYKTEPVGVKNQDEFLNVVVWIRTSLDREEFYSRVKQIEKEAGRLERERWGPREIDIDILMFGDHIVNGPAIVIPHKEMMNRRFVLQPFAEIAPDAIHPAAHTSIKELLAVCGDTNAIELSTELTRSLFLTLQES